MSNDFSNYEADCGDRNIRARSHDLLSVLYALKSLECNLQFFIGRDNEYGDPAPFGLDCAHAAFIRCVVALGIDFDPERA